MKMLLENDDDFREFSHELSRRLADREIRKTDNPGFRKAAVMMLVMNRNGAPSVLVTRRTDKVGTHKGQMAFPGGSVDPDDEDSLAAAYRETFEEVGVPGDKIEFLGQYDEYISIAGFHVDVFVGAVDFPVEYKFNEGEIDGYVEAPLSIFVNEEYDRTECFEFRDKEYTVYHYLYNGYDIWGMTARILTDFARKVLAD